MGAECQAAADELETTRRLRVLRLEYCQRSAELCPPPFLRCGQLFDVPALLLGDGSIPVNNSTLVLNLDYLQGAGTAQGIF